MAVPKIHETNVTLVGAGLVGSLLSIFLARRGYKVELFERRPDMRLHSISAGRSINLAISTRGINALHKLGLEREVLSQAIPMRGRMIHSTSSELMFQPYGKDDSQYINSISRATLNKILMNYAEKAGVKIHFNQKITGFFSPTHTLDVLDENGKRTYKHSADVIIGTDGSASVIRDEMAKTRGYEFSQTELDYGYKELVIPPADGGGFKLEKNALHIWPRGTYMLIALPNFEGSFTCTLFLPFKGEISFEALNSRAKVTEFFEAQFPDAVPLISDLEETFFANPTGHMPTVKCSHWNMGSTALLVGDAAHGIVPFFGQGMNCGFEDCTFIEEVFDRFVNNDGETDWGELFREVSRNRIPNTNAIADMAVENFIEMRDKVDDEKFLLEKAVEKVLQKQFPGRYISRYALVTFSNVPYKVAFDAGVVSDEILQELCRDLEDPLKVNLVLAQKLIDERLAPLLKPYENQLETAAAH